MSKFTLALQVPALQMLPLSNGLPLTKITTKLAGTVIFTPLKATSHQGISVQITGLVLVNKLIKSVFFELQKDIFGAEKSTLPRSIPFDLGQVQLPYSTGKAGSIEIIYCLKAILKTSNTAKYLETPSSALFFERFVPSPQREITPFKTEVGAENAIQIEIQTSNTTLNLARDSFLGSVNFLLCQKKFVQMEVILRVRSQYKERNQIFVHDWEDIFRYQAMEGAPVRGEIVPFKIPLFRLQEAFCSFVTEDCKIDWSVLVDVSDTDGQHYFKEILLNFWWGEDEAAE
ncbi:Vacuolar protein sorting 26 [Spironucleus salmonicida]|uniref:Vacuolar protein sorting 26 n=2 Tax=Spironucleus TaxID=39709 RepID=V6LHP5_9EUKA|nr:Vacuolar protein sorting 26 [Spironucleus salmonicida]|eukprot:EST43211.1 Vacuolar protein sorting-associated protein 26 [Spironucleus salmonicida]